MNSHSEDNFPFSFNPQACDSCGGRCCRGESGHVWVSDAEVVQLAQLRNLSIASFSKQYLRSVNGRLSLQERFINQEYACCFLDTIGGSCNVYDTRPAQCRTFPYWDKYKVETQELFLLCPGVSESEIRE